jgi:hypothetical protein
VGSMRKGNMGVEKGGHEDGGGDGEGEQEDRGKVDEEYGLPQLKLPF